MNRREFNGIMLSATIGTVVGPAWTNSKGTEHYDVRIGGPVFQQYNNPNEWIIALNEVRYRAAYCPVGGIILTFNDICELRVENKVNKNCCISNLKYF